jgi:hypothetical protein
MLTRNPPQIRYTIQTVTGDLPGAGTSAAVFIQVRWPAIARQPSRREGAP